MIKRILIITAVLALPILMFSQELNQVDDLNRKQGKWRKTYPNGTIRYQGQFHNNRPYGVFKYYDENANLKAITVFSDDGIIGRTKTFYKTGQLMAEGKYINQLKDSTWLYYSDIDSCLIASEEYKDGVLNGKSISYFPKSKQPVRILNYKNGLKEGAFQKFFKNGQIMTEGTYKDDLLEGEFILYYSNGNIEQKGKYTKGVQTGKWQYFDENGQPVSEDEYKSGKANTGERDK